MCVVVHICGRDGGASSASAVPSDVVSDSTTNVTMEKDNENGDDVDAATPGKIVAVTSSSLVAVAIVALLLSRINSKA